jgi:hypothetical protein
VLLALGLVSAGRRLLRRLRAAERSEDRAAALAALGALVGVGLHELVDFGLTMPANSFTLAIVVGAALGVRVRRGQGGGSGQREAAAPGAGAES